MKRYLILFFILAPFISFAQSKMSGKTYSKSENLYFVHIVIKDASQRTVSTTSDQNGNYSISLSNGKYEISATYVGYKNFQKQIEINSDTDVDIVMEEDITKLSEVVVRSLPQKTTEISVIRTLRNSNVVSDGFMVITLGAFGIASVDKFINAKKGKASDNEEELG